MPAWKNPNWTEEKKKWFMATIEALVSKPEQANILTHYANRFDLEIGIVVAPEDEPVFTELLLDALSVVVGQATGFWKPVIYLEGKPSEKIARLIYDADHHL